MGKKPPQVVHNYELKGYFEHEAHLFQIEEDLNVVRGFTNFSQHSPEWWQLFEIYLFKDLKNINPSLKFGNPSNSELVPSQEYCENDLVDLMGIIAFSKGRNARKFCQFLQTVEQYVAKVWHTVEQDPRKAINAFLEHPSNFEETPFNDVLNKTFEVDEVLIRYSTIDHVLYMANLKDKKPVITGFIGKLFKRWEFSLNIQNFENGDDTKYPYIENGLYATRLTSLQEGAKILQVLAEITKALQKFEQGIAQDDAQVLKETVDRVFGKS